MTEREALLRAVCEHPEDDLPRLVLADWLDEHGTDAGRLREPGRWEWTASGCGPWRLYWRAMPAGVRDPYTFVGHVDPPPCQDAECRSGWATGVAVDGRCLCWPCAARNAIRASRKTLQES